MEKMTRRKNLIFKCSIKIFLMILICAIISTILTCFAPHLSNDLAIGQLENDDAYFSIMTMWNMISNAISIIEIFVVVIFLFSIGIDIYKFFKTEKEEIE